VWAKACSNNQGENGGNVYVKIAISDRNETLETLGYDREGSGLYWIPVFILEILECRGSVFPRAVAETVAGCIIGR
jgi:hypothetical protein